MEVEPFPLLETERNLPRRRIQAQSSYCAAFPVACNYRGYECFHGLHWWPMQSLRAIRKPTSQPLLTCELIQPEVVHPSAADNVRAL